MLDANHTKLKQSPIVMEANVLAGRSKMNWYALTVNRTCMVLPIMETDQ